VSHRSKRHGDERGTLQYDLVFLAAESRLLFAEDFIWESHRPSRRLQSLPKGCGKYCFQFAKSLRAVLPEQCLRRPMDAKDRERRKKLAHNYVRVHEPPAGSQAVQAGPDMVRPSRCSTSSPSSVRTRLNTQHIPLGAAFFIQLMTRLVSWSSTRSAAPARPQSRPSSWAVAAVTELDGKYAACCPTLRAGADLTPGV